MGRLEKIVVLTVLFLVAVILAISLKQGDGRADKAGPLASLDPSANQNGPALGSQGAGAQPGSADGAGILPGAANGAMNTVVQPDPKPALALNPGAGGGNPTAAPGTPTHEVKSLATPPAGSALKTREGLQESLFNDLYMYVWQAGDTYPLLAERYYGSQKHALRLRTANEGRTEATLKVGDKIFVPNVEAPAPVLQEPASAPGGAAQPGGTASAPRKSGVAPDGLYVVQKGDVLGTIAQKVYGTSKKWQKIYDANRDVLKDPNSLKVGMKLRIPE